MFDTVLVVVVVVVFTRTTIITWSSDWLIFGAFQRGENNNKWLSRLSTRWECVAAPKWTSAHIAIARHLSCWPTGTSFIVWSSSSSSSSNIFSSARPEVCSVDLCWYDCFSLIEATQKSSRDKHRESTNKMIFELLLAPLKLDGWLCLWALNFIDFILCCCCCCFFYFPVENVHTCRYHHQTKQQQQRTERE